METVSPRPVLLDDGAEAFRMRLQSFLLVGEMVCEVRLFEFIEIASVRSRTMECKEVSL